MRSLVYLIKFLSKIPRKCEVKMIEFYQKYISPGLGNHCKFYPTCSEYAKQAIDNAVDYVSKLPPTSHITVISVERK